MFWNQVNVNKFPFGLYYQLNFAFSTNYQQIIRVNKTWAATATRIRNWWSIDQWWEERREENWQLWKNWWTGNEKRKCQCKRVSVNRLRLHFSIKLNNRKRSHLYSEGALTFVMQEKERKSQSNKLTLNVLKSFIV